MQDEVQSANLQTEWKYMYLSLRCILMYINMQVTSTLSNRIGEKPRIP